MAEEKELVLEFVGIDYWSRPVYKGADGRLFADINCDNGCIVDLHTLSGNEMDGEPDMPIERLKKYAGLKIKLTGRENESTKEERFNCQMLSRLQSDCDYYLGYGGRCASHLWAGNEKDQIEKMKEIWNSFPQDKKPEWLTWEQILDYENKMIVGGC